MKIGLQCIWKDNKFEYFFKYDCYTSQLKYIFWLEENVSRAIGQNSLMP